MSERTPAYTATTQRPLQVNYIDDRPDLRQWLLDLRRDLLRKVKQIDEMLANLPQEH